MKILLISALFFSGLAGAQAAPQLCEDARDAGFRYTSEGYILSPEDFRTDYRINPTILSQLGALRAALGRNGVQLVPLVLPLRAMVYPGTLSGYSSAAGRAEYDSVISYLQSQGFIVPNLLTYARQNAAGQQIFRKQDGHLIGDGARIMARGAAQKLASAGVLRGVPSSKFVTTFRQNGISGAKDNAWAVDTNKLCGGTLNFPPDPWRLYQTAPVEEVGLLDETTAPQVILAGTSQSGNTINLVGELKTALGVDVLNVHVDGGGIYSSLLNYLTGPEYTAARPKVILWEFSLTELFSERPDAFSLKSPQALPMLRAAANGPCTAPIWSKTGRSVQLPALTGNNYLMVSSSAAGQRSVTVRADRDLTALTIPARQSNTGVWYYPLSPKSAGVARLEGVDGATLTARVCRSK